jgi:hypothetical protein
MSRYRDPEMCIWTQRPSSPVSETSGHTQHVYYYPTQILFVPLQNGLGLCSVLLSGLALGFSADSGDHRGSPSHRSNAKAPGPGHTTLNRKL